MDKYPSKTTSWPSGAPYIPDGPTLGFMRQGLAMKYIRKRKARDERLIRFITDAKFGDPSIGGNHPRQAAYDYELVHGCPAWRHLDEEFNG